MHHRFIQRISVWGAFKGLEDVPESAFLVVGERRDEIPPTFLPSLLDCLLSILAGRQPLFSVTAHFLPSGVPLPHGFSYFRGQAGPAVPSGFGLSHVFEDSVQYEVLQSLKPFG